MNFLRGFQLIKNYWPQIVIIILSLLASRWLLTPGYFNMHDDLQMMRQLQMEKCLYDLQIPCRWNPDMGFGLGLAQFNYYPPLPYLFGQLIRFAGYSFVDTAKITFSFSIVFSGLAMYALSKNFFGKTGALVSAALYIWAPYHGLDIFVRGAMNESWAFVFFPLLLLTSYKIISEDKRRFSWAVYFALTTAGILLTHNLMVLIFLPILAAWVFMSIVSLGKAKGIIHLLFGGMTGISLAAFFTLPMLFEQNYVKLDMLTKGYFDFRGHFVSVGQMLFSRFWGGGSSEFGTVNDGMGFSVGQIHWILSLIVLFYIIFKFRQTKGKAKTVLLLVILLVLSGWFAIFMAHSRSTFLWLAIPKLDFIQFPWRFLAIPTFAFSFAAGILPSLVKLNGKLKLFLVTTLVAFAVFYNWKFFIPTYFAPLTDEVKFSGKPWEVLQQGGTFDYLPKSAKTEPFLVVNSAADIVSGNAVIVSQEEGTNWVRVTVNANEDSVLRINTYQFPDWRVYLNDRQVEEFVPDYENHGRMHVNIPIGTHEVYARFYNTPIRTFANLISIFSLIALVAVLFIKKPWKQER